jgi:dihydroorotate dehydrogenase (NAD+) catalytic subunit
MGLPNPGISDFTKELTSVKRGKMIVIGSIFGKDAKEYSKLARKMEEAGTAAVELNLSCPHAKGLGMELGTDPAMVKKITKAVSGAVNIPVWAKLTPHAPNIVEVGASAVAGGADALVAINTVKAMRINMDTGQPVLGNRSGGLSGPAIKPVGIRAVYDLASNLDVPIIGVGGIMSGEDAAEYMMAGASAVQVGSAVFYHGFGAFKKISKELSNYLKIHGYKNIKDITGLALKK